MNGKVIEKDGFIILGERILLNGTNHGRITEVNGNYKLSIGYDK